MVCHFCGLPLILSLSLHNLATYCLIVLGLYQLLTQLVLSSFGVHFDSRFAITHEDAHCWYLPLKRPWSGTGSDSCCISVFICVVVNMIAKISILPASTLSCDSHFLHVFQIIASNFGHLKFWSQIYSDRGVWSNFEGLLKRVWCLASVKHALECSEV